MDTNDTSSLIIGVKWYNAPKVTSDDKPMVTSQGGTINGTGDSSTNSYWILRKPCTKAEFEEAVEMAKKK